MTRYCVNCGLSFEGGGFYCQLCGSRRPMTPYTDPRGSVDAGDGLVSPTLSEGYRLLNDDEPLSWSERRDNIESRKRPKRRRDMDWRLEA